MPPRVMWLLNHSTARKFEVAMLKSIGIEQIFLPKIVPRDPSFRSASVDWSEDTHLTIPREELDVLNAADWYAGADENAWRIANRHFDICFFIVHNLSVLKAAAKYFEGALLWRAYGLAGGYTYSRETLSLEQGAGWRSINKLGKRFFFAQAYAHLDRDEHEVFQRRSVCLPLGLHSAHVDDRWQGKDKRIFFVCPDLAFNPYYQGIYSRFVEDFRGLPYAIGGAQPIAVGDPAVLGFLPQVEHDENMRNMRLMFYHSTDAGHIHYHPFEAIRAGLPLLFMAGGMLDRMGGIGLPGRCASIKEARAKAARILNDDFALIKAIKRTQGVLLEPMKPERCIDAWRAGFARVVRDLETSRSEHQSRPTKAKPMRVAVILPISYRGGTFRGAKLLARALHAGSRHHGNSAEIVFVHPDDNDAYADVDFADLPADILRRRFAWKRLSVAEARRAMRYAGYAEWQPVWNEYIAVDDGIRSLLDCDAWIVVSDRLSVPLLPLRPRIHMVYDYVQRYKAVLPQDADRAFLDAARFADLVLVTTRATEQDALQYAGVPATRIAKVPMLAQFFPKRVENLPSPSKYFLWTTNAAAQKNHRNALTALALYYEKWDGRLDCMVTGLGTDALFAGAPLHLRGCAEMIEQRASLRERLRWRGELPDVEYQAALEDAAFLWHAGSIDNGTLSVVEAASLGVPALSSDYAAMREIDQQFSLALAWMKVDDPSDMARQLKQMEQSCISRRMLLPNAEKLAEQRVDRLGDQYWEAVRRCL